MGTGVVWQGGVRWGGCGWTAEGLSGWAVCAQVKLGRCCSGGAGFRLGAMTNKVSKSKTAVRAAREAVRAAQKDVLERAARNSEDLAVFFSSQERLAAVDDWLEAKIAGLREQADVKRAEHRRTAGLSLTALRDRGETVRDIAALTGVGEKALRELMRFAEATNGAAPEGPMTDEMRRGETEAFLAQVDAAMADDASSAESADGGASLGASTGPLSATG